MKFMKLGSRPDTFFTSNNSTRTLASDIPTDITIQIQDTKFELHKFPLLSKCFHLKRLLLESPEPAVDLTGFPGGAAAFELCVKFCYNVVITISAANVVAARCAAAYLDMSDEFERGNLAGKLDSFLNSCVLRGWKDSIVALQSTRKLRRWSEEIGITGRCIEAVSKKILAEPAPELRRPDGRWWAEDLAELGVDHFWRIMVLVKSAGDVSGEVVAAAVAAYATRWFPDSTAEDSNCPSEKRRVVVEKLISLLPPEKGKFESIPCRILLRLLRAANAAAVSAETKADLTQRVGIQLDRARLDDILIPPGEKEGLFDVDLVLSMLEEFRLQQSQSPPMSPAWRKAGEGERRRRSRSAEDLQFDCGRMSSGASHGAKLRVAKLVDEYLQEIARDVDLPMDKFIAVAVAVPEFARINHDDLYRAIDIYLKTHPDTTKSERKKICRILDRKKLSMDGCKHAAQNERLPLRVIVQVLFFEQVRSTGPGSQASEIPGNLKVLLGSVSAADTDNWSMSNDNYKKTTLRMKLEEDEDDYDYEEKGGLMRSSSSRFRALCAIPNKPKGVLSKLWPMNRSIRERH